MQLFKKPTFITETNLIPGNRVKYSTKTVCSFVFLLSMRLKKNNNRNLHAFTEKINLEQMDDVIKKKKKL